MFSCCCCCRCRQKPTFVESQFKELYWAGFFSESKLIFLTFQWNSLHKLLPINWTRPLKNAMLFNGSLRNGSLNEVKLKLTCSLPGDIHFHFYLAASELFEFRKARNREGEVKKSLSWRLIAVMRPLFIFLPSLFLLSFTFTFQLILNEFSQFAIQYYLFVICSRPTIKQQQ